MSPAWLKPGDGVVTSYTPSNSNTGVADPFGGWGNLQGCGMWPHRPQIYYLGRWGKEKLEERSVFWVHNNPFSGLPRWLSGKESTCKAGDTSLIPGSGRSPGEENGNPLQYSCLKNPMDRQAWQAICNPWGYKESDHNSATKITTILSLSSICICNLWKRWGEGCERKKKAKLYDIFPFP